MLEAFLSSVTLVAISEIGDKTQLLALVLAARFRRPWPICLGILVATVFNHAAAGWVGQLLASWLRPEWLQWGLAASLFLMAGWMLIPDKIDEDEFFDAKDVLTKLSLITTEEDDEGMEYGIRIHRTI